MPKNRLTLNVLADISRKVDNKDNFDSKDTILVAFTGSNIDLSKRIEELKVLKNRGTMFSLAFSFMASRIIDVDNIVYSLSPIRVYKEEDVFEIEEIVNRYSSIICPNITINTLSKVSLGMVDSFISNLIWTYLYKGRPVYLDFSSVRNYMGEKTDNKGINRIIDNHIRTIKELGAIEIGAEKYLNNIADVKESSVKSEFNKVITESDLKDIPEGKSLILKKGTIITPLAKDKAALMGIKLEIEN